MEGPQPKGQNRSCPLPEAQVEGRLGRALRVPPVPATHKLPELELGDGEKAVGDTSEVKMGEQAGPAQTH